jgi:hypothetical protein
MHKNNIQLTTDAGKFLSRTLAPPAGSRSSLDETGQVGV